jgi:Tfp pilus assembly protein PilF
MFRKKTIALSICGLFSMVGCASMSDQANWQVEPVYGVKDGGKTSAELYRLGQYYQRRVRYDQAITAYKAALDRDPGLAEAHNGLGVVYARQGRYEEAIREFRDAIAIAPRSAYLYNNLGYAYLLQGSIEPATEALEEARRLDPANKKVLRNLSLARRDDEQVDTKNIRKPAVAKASAGPRVHSTHAVTDKLTGARPDIALVAVAPNVYELRERETGLAEEKTVALRARPSPTSGHHDSFVKPESFRFEVSNGNGITGMAARVAKLLEGIGIKTALLTNHLPFEQASTEIQYRDGYQRQAAKLGAALEAPIDLVKNDALRDGINVRLLLGRDVVSEAALFEENGSKTSIAALEHVRLEVSNGNGVTGLAGRVAKRLNHVGVQTALLTNQRPFDQATTEIQYRDGYRAAATGLSAALKVPMAVVRSDELHADIQVRLVLGKDLHNDAVLFGLKESPVRIASHGDVKDAR